MDYRYTILLGQDSNVSNMGVLTGGIWGINPPSPKDLYFLT